MKKVVVFVIVWFLAYLLVAAVAYVANLETLSYVKALNNSMVWQISIVFGWIPATIAAYEIDNPPY